MAEIRDDEFKGQPTMLGDMVVYPQPWPHHDPDSVRTERENGPHTEAGHPLTPEVDLSKLQPVVTNWPDKTTFGSGRSGVVSANRRRNMSAPERQSYDPVFTLGHDYGSHHYWCDMLDVHKSDACTCGFARALADADTYVSSLSAALSSDDATRPTGDGE